VKVGKLDHVAINVENIETSVGWYISNLEAEVDYQDDTWAMLSVGDSKLALTVADQHPPHVAFAVDNFTMHENFKVHRDGSKYIYKVDPDGNTIELICWEA
tara:strand:+ start:1013 stop:1315 length:303 start_codon:yes stop_codon:yes gene_type:complete